jgi:hypothetical protein
VCAHLSEGFLSRWNEVILDKSLVRLSYLRSWFALEFPASIPWALVAYFLPLQVPAAPGTLNPKA